MLNKMSMKNLKEYEKRIQDVDIGGVLHRTWIRQILPYKLSVFLKNRNIIRYANEAKKDKLINDRMLKKTGYKWQDIDPFGIVLYAIIRSTKPTVIVETGVQSGISRLYILRALEINGSGLLHR